MCAAGTSRDLPADVESKCRVDSDIEGADWYWGSISREVSVELLKGAATGTYLVRDASTKAGEYTLTVRYYETNKLLRIYNFQGKFGLEDSNKFSSVVELINYFRNNSLSKYNKDLETKLLYPLSQFTYTQELIKELETLSPRYLMTDRYFELHLNLKSHTQDTIRDLTKDLEAFDAAIGSYQSQQSRLHELVGENLGDLGDLAELGDLGALADAPGVPVEITLRASFAHLRKKIQNLENLRAKVNDNLRMTKLYSDLIDGELRERKVELDDLKNQRLCILQKLQMLENTKVNRADYAEKAVPQVVDIWDEDLWYNPNATREDAGRVLDGRESGTFVVRKSRSGGYALSLTLADGKVYHCILLHRSSGVGFGEANAYFPSLKAIILYYSMNSLEKCNTHLTTCLLHPGYAGQRPQPQRESLTDQSKGNL